MFRRATRDAEPDTDAAAVDLAVVTDTSFLDDTGGEVAIVDFWAPWCGPCRSFAPIFRGVAAARTRPELRFGTCNVDENQQTAQMLGVQTIPTVIGFDGDGNEVGRVIGVPTPRALDELLSRVEAAR